MGEKKICISSNELIYKIGIRESEEGFELLDTLYSSIQDSNILKIGDKSVDI